MQSNRAVIHIIIYTVFTNTADKHNILCCADRWLDADTLLTFH